MININNLNRSKQYLIETQVENFRIPPLLNPDEFKICLMINDISVPFEKFLMSFELILRNSYAREIEKGEIENRELREHNQKLRHTMSEVRDLLNINQHF